MASDGADIDAIAAALRSDAGDLRVYLNVLAAKLEAALPGMVEIDRRRPQALYDARELAMERMQSEAQEVEAEGVVGVQLHERSHGWGSHMIEFFAIGTAVIPISDEHTIASPTLVLPMDG